MIVFLVMALIQEDCIVFQIFYEYFVGIGYFISTLICSCLFREQNRL
jgi:hypothetical protein